MQTIHLVISMRRAVPVVTTFDTASLATRCAHATYAHTCTHIDMRASYHCMPRIGLCILVVCRARVICLLLRRLIHSWWKLFRDRVERMQVLVLGNL